MEETFIYSVLVRWGHTLFGIAWIGLLYYFNFVQTEYVKVADPDAKSDVMKKLAPNALWWFRWAAFFTFVTGVTLLYYLQVLAKQGVDWSNINGGKGITVRFPKQQALQLGINIPQDADYKDLTIIGYDQNTNSFTFNN